MAESRSSSKASRADSGNTGNTGNAGTTGDTGTAGDTGDTSRGSEGGPTGPSDSGSDWHTRSADDVLSRFDVSLDRGLDGDEVRRRLDEHGPNRLRGFQTPSWGRVLLAQLRSMVIYLLCGAAVLALATGRWPEGIAVLAVIVVNTGIGFVSEWRATRSMAALREMGEGRARVRRGGNEQEIPGSEIVPGDLVLLAVGGVVPADLRLVRTDHLRINEAALTGESVPADKTSESVGLDAPLAERSGMAYRGTSVVDGSAVGVAVATGIGTELGRISELAESAESAALPLQARLDLLGRRLGLLTVGIAIAVAGIGFLVRRQETALVVETALALGIAAIPEGLPIVATIALARGMYLMAQRNAVVNRLPAVEALGATRVILTDKTGTLTENRMRLRKLVTAAGERSFDDGEAGHGDEGVEDEGTPRSAEDADDLVRRTLEVAVLCNSGSLEQEPNEEAPGGDPTELALLAAGAALGLEREVLIRERPQLRVEAFEPRVKKMATFHEEADGVYVAVKGAPDAVLEVCVRMATGAGGDDDRPLDDEDRQRWLDRSRELASEGLRVLAVADKRVQTEGQEPYEGLCFVGLLGLHDPPRASVREAIDTCQAAGIRVEMVTGDQPETARAIAHAVGITGGVDDPETVVLQGFDLEDPATMDEEQRERVYSANIFARVSPEQKLNLVQIHQDRGNIVAMTGDGVNDAPALKKADIGLAMGRRGTEAAKQVADMVLLDDAFETIVAAVEEGRVIFDNIRRSVMFMLTTNIAEVLAVTIATLVGWTLPLLPLQILYLNVLTDVFPALALGVGKASGNEMDRPPRDRNEPVLTTAHWLEISAWAGVTAACVLGSLLLAERWLGLSGPAAVTVSFLTLGFAKLWFTFTLRSPDSGPIRNEVTRNPWVWGAILFCILLLLAAVHLPGLSDVLRTSAPDARAWGLLLALSLVPLGVGQVAREIQGRRRSS